MSSHARDPVPNSTSNEQRVARRRLVDRVSIELIACECGSFNATLA